VKKIPRESSPIRSPQRPIISASRSFYSTFQLNPAETEGRLFYEIGQRQWDIPALPHLLEGILRKNTPFEDFRVEYDSPATWHKALLPNACSIAREGSKPDLILLAMEDITGSSAISGISGEKR
jgi:hypothetical protein